MYLKLNLDNLPKSFKNVIFDANDELTVIRSDVNDFQSIKKWLEEFSLNTKTKWNTRTSVPNGTYIQCSKRYICHHNDYKKVDGGANKRGRSKNTGCKAKIKFVVKLDTRYTRRNDPFIKRKMLGVITIHNEHNHDINSLESLRYLPANTDVRETFEKYFNDGMTITEAIRYHESVIMTDCTAEDLANSRINPTYRTIQNWYYRWKRFNLGLSTTCDVSKKLGEGEEEEDEEKESSDENEIFPRSPSETFELLNEENDPIAKENCSEQIEPRNEQETFVNEEEREEKDISDQNEIFLCSPSETYVLLDKKSNSITAENYSDQIAPHTELEIFEQEKEGKEISDENEVFLCSLSESFMLVNQKGHSAIDENSIEQTESCNGRESETSINIKRVLDDIFDQLGEKVAMFGPSTYENLTSFKNRLDRIQTGEQFNAFLANARFT